MGGLLGERVIWWVSAEIQRPQTSQDSYAPQGSEGIHPSNTAGSFWLENELLVVRAQELITGGPP